MILTSTRPERRRAQREEQRPSGSTTYRLPKMRASKYKPHFGKKQREKAARRMEASNG